MSPFEKAAEKMIREAMERGEFDHLPGKGKPIDLTAYFDTPEEVRLAYSILKNAGMVPREAELLKEIAELRQMESALVEEKTLAPGASAGERIEIRKQIEKKQIEFSLMMERNHRSAKKR